VSNHVFIIFVPLTDIRLFCLGYPNYALHRVLSTDDFLLMILCRIQTGGNKSGRSSSCPKSPFFWLLFFLVIWWTTILGEKDTWFRFALDDIFLSFYSFFVLFIWVGSTLLFLLIYLFLLINFFFKKKTSIVFLILSFFLHI